MSEVIPYMVLRDNREQKPQDFAPYKTAYHHCLGTEDTTLTTGDYTIKGLEDKLCVERKGSISELANNLGRGKLRFMDEIGRMASFPHKFIICEFPISDLYGWPQTAKMSNWAKKNTKIRANYLLKCMTEFEVQNGIHVLYFADAKEANKYMSNLFKRVNEIYPKEARNEHD